MFNMKAMNVHSDTTFLLCFPTYCFWPFFCMILNILTEFKNCACSKMLQYAHYWLKDIFKVFSGTKSLHLFQKKIIQNSVTSFT